MTNNDNKNKWTPDWENRYRYVQKQYDNARLMGIDLLKLFLQVVIALNIIPLLFHERIFSLFKHNISDIYLSWIYILISVLTGFLAYFFVFEGYYRQSHLEAVRWLSTESNSKKIKKYNRQSDLSFNISYYLAVTAVISFIFGIIFIIKAIWSIL